MRMGLIAGSGQFPLIFLKAAELKGVEVFALALEGEADPESMKLARSVEWVCLGEMEKMMLFFKKNNIQEAVLLGAVNKTKMFSDFKPDMTAISIVSRMKDTHDDALLRAFADALETRGIMIRPSTLLLPELVSPPGCWTARKPSGSEEADMKLGVDIARKIGALDIGQSVVVGGGSVLAVEAMDGTDATIKRGGALAKKGAVVVKTAKPGQDMRFDVPAVGMDTLRSMKDAGVTALGVEAEKTLSFDRQEMVKFADESGISIVGLEPVA
ncbi:MAG: UDP-2,3-diacylglucosamine diphosphatase LpxI [Proteobacteria bacterium]|nr:UDP-2,3-diacylglucosamine diphosphatase LpxI [Pseudomonadota bacterium]MBU4470669.1 UDP-2,3-diacylglucosamine diphosphatase LpxI [Pseudomonadota bacterium]